VAIRPIADMDAYRQSLTRFVTHTGMFMRPVFGAARANPKRVAYAEGEEERVLRAVQIALDEKLVRPILIGRPAVIDARIERAGLRIRPGRDFEVVNPEDDVRFRQYWEAYFHLNARDGVTPEMAKAAVRRSNTTIGALMVHLGDADAMLCGLVGRYDAHLDHVREVIGLRPGAQTFAALNALMLPSQTLFVTDAYVNDDPSAEQLCDIAAMAAEAVRYFGLDPRIAFLSHSAFGSSRRPSALKMRRARDLFVQRMPEVPADGEMHGDVAFDEDLRRVLMPDSTLSGSANLLVLPNLDSANILFNVLKITGGHGVTVGPILLGVNAPVHIVTPSATVRRVVNMTAIAVAHAGALAAR
jgi:malate dehydrogenase (oxaloacetate-decarboxylating)(NADP+)